MGQPDGQFMTEESGNLDQNLFGGGVLPVLPGEVVLVRLVEELPPAGLHECFEVGRRLGLMGVLPNELGYLLGH